jgi:RNAse (barnase) inhibitor barstar
MNKKVYEIDGNNFSTLEEFCDEFNRKMNLEISWNGNLDALNDILVEIICSEGHEDIELRLE